MVNNNVVYVVTKSILDNERYYIATGKATGGFDLRSKSVREIFFSLEDAQAYVNRKAEEFKEKGRSIYAWENGKVVECSRRVRDSWVRIEIFDIDVKEVR